MTTNFRIKRIFKAKDLYTPFFQFHGGNDFSTNIESQIIESECVTEKGPYSTYDPEDILGYPDFF